MLRTKNVSSPAIAASWELTQRVHGQNKNGAQHLTSE